MDILLVFVAVTAYSV